VSPLDDNEWVAVSAMVFKKDSADTMDRLQALGACDIFLLGLVSFSKVFTQTKDWKEDADLT
jgi:ATP phosphoribosyltransferase